MKTRFLTVFLGLAVLMLAGCGTPATNTTDGATSKPVAAAPTPDALFALDKQANEAYFKSDAKFFEGVLSEKFVMHEDGQRMDKAAVLKMIAGNKCDLNGWKLEEPQMSRIDADTYVLAYKGTIDGSCSGPDGKSVKLPSPVRAATVWVRSGEKWLAAYHGENLIIDPKDLPPAKAGGKKKERQKDEKAAADPNTEALMVAERNIWEAWKAKDAKRLEELTTKDLAFMNIFGTYFANKADTLKDWSGGTCDIKSVSVADGAGTLLSPTVAILTSKGTAAGTCGGPKLTPVPVRWPVYGTSVYVKDGDTWKLAFGLNRPLN